MSNIEIAQKTIKEIAYDLGLTFQEVQEDGLEYSVELNEQEGLNFPINLFLINGDMLGFVFGDVFSGNVFPCTDLETRSYFKKIIKGFITGELVVKNYDKGSFIFRELEDSKGEIYYSYGLPCFIPFGRMDCRKLLNFEIINNNYIKNLKKE